MGAVVTGTLRFGVLGPLEVLCDGQPLRLGGERQRALLALLLLNANETVSADRLIEELWGEQAPESGRTALQVRISQLRKALGPAGAQLVTRPPGYVLRLDSGQLDLFRFERLVAEADTAEPTVAAEKLREAVALWRGAPLADLAYESFAQPAIRRLEELRLAAVERRIDADLALGRQADLVAELQMLALEHPLRERFWAQLMLALYRCGRQADALAAYQSARGALVEQLGIEPGPPLRELEQAILVQDPGLVLAPVTAFDRSLLAVGLDESALGPLLALAAPLVQRPGRELVIVRLITRGRNLAVANADVQQRRAEMSAAGIAVRAAVFTSSSAGADAVRTANELDCDLIVIHGPAEPLENAAIRAVLATAPCDVAVLVGAEPVAGPVLVPFVGAQHDWSAIELGAWLAGAWQVPLRVAGPALPGRDASRLLASASLAIQHAYGIAAEPLLVAAGPDGLVRASEDAAALVIVGLSERWRQQGLGETRAALARLAIPVVIVCRGLRPGGLAPRESHTRFTWSLGTRPA
ncbi:MAG: AfsR/SARP family transcriptional regulator [Solirubrobacterales bacterium]|nr:AfsR/SARP family transcriptional regulator [Solirubrobacterales bacterium]